MGNKNSNCHTAAAEDFIIKLHKEQLKNGAIDLSKDNPLLSDQRRRVFISLNGLYQSWSLCPVSILYSSIFILPIKRKWIYAHKNEKQKQNELKNSIIGKMTIFKDTIAFEEFLKLLQWKDSQNLLFCMLDYENCLGNNDDKLKLIAPFWIHLNDKLTKLCDPISRKHYNPINLDTKWWKYGEFSSKFGVKPYKILIELYFLTMNFKSLSEMIFQSNPKGLKPICAYNPFQLANSDSVLTGFVSEKCKNREINSGFVPFENCCPDLADSGLEMESDNEGVWMISAEYNEYDSS